MQSLGAATASHIGHNQYALRKKKVVQANVVGRKIYGSCAKRFEKDGSEHKDCELPSMEVLKSRSGLAVLALGIVYICSRCRQSSLSNDVDFITPTAPFHNGAAYVSVVTTRYES